MMLALLLSLAITQDPAVTVQINHDRFAPGDRARVYVQMKQDGYLVVLHADPDGRVRVLFPLDPTDDDFMRGGKRQELRGRADRDAFQVDDEDGSGLVLAAVMPDPFRYDAFVRNGHWDYRVLRDSSVRDDPLSGLLNIVQRMAAGSHFEYDAVTYVVNSRPIASRYGYGDGWGYRFGIRLGFGYPYRYGYYNPFYDPFCYDPFFWGWSASCFGYGGGFGFGYTYYRPFTFYRPYTFYRPRFYGFGRTVVSGPRFVIPGGRSRYEPVQARPRSGSGDRVLIRDRGVQRDRGIEPRIVAPRGRDGGGISRPQPRSSGGRPTVSRGWSGGSRPSVSGRGGGGRRH